MAEVCRKVSSIKNSIFIKNKTEYNIKMNKQFLAFGDKVDDSKNCSKQYHLRLIGSLEGWKLEVGLFYKGLSIIKQPIL